MSSIAISLDSSRTAPELPRYTGPDYRAALAGELGLPDPLLHPDPYRPPALYRVALALIHWLLPRLFRVRLEGLENLPRPPFILASNHQRWYDPAFLALALPRRPMVYSMARRETVFNRAWKRAIVPRLGVFPISPQHGELDESGVVTVYQILARGGIVLIFPEGRYSRGRRLLPLRKGVAHFALQAGVPIVPVALEGVDRLRPFTRVVVSVGKPIWPDPPAWWIPSRRVLEIVDRVRRCILRAFDRPPRQRRRLLARLGAGVRDRLGRLTSWRGRSPS